MYYKWNIGIERRHFYAHSFPLRVEYAEYAVQIMTARTHEAAAGVARNYFINQSYAVRGKDGSGL
jgi:hypothetical protein